MKIRLDQLLVDRGLVPSRTKAQALVLAGEVVVGEQRVDKPGTQVPDDAVVRLKSGAALRYVSRGGFKLEAALDQFGLDPNGLVCADLGASTGGFSDCLLQRGARQVHACDVGYGLLDVKIASNPRVLVHDRLNVRGLTPHILGGRVALCTIDVAFISLELVLPAVRGILTEHGTVVALVKPQFEVGAANIAKGGVVRDPVARQEAIDRVWAVAPPRGVGVEGGMNTPVHRPAGHGEALAWLQL